MLTPDDRSKYLADLEVRRRNCISPRKRLAAVRFPRNNPRLGPSGWGAGTVVRICLTMLLLVFFGGLGEVRAQQDQPPQEPKLRIDPGMHTTRINRVGVDARCTLLATGSEDKTVRLWRLPERKLVRTLRPPSGPDQDGKIYAVAMAPDGSWIAAGGWNRACCDHWVYVFEVSTGRVAARLGPMGSVINHLAISPDGRYLVAALHGTSGVRVWQRTAEDLVSWQIAVEDQNYGGESYHAAFDRAGALYAVAFDGKLRRYAPGFVGKPSNIETRSGKEAYSVAVDPSGDHIAVGFHDTPKVDVYDAKTLALLFTADSKVGSKYDNKVDSQALAWSSDGKRLYSGGERKDRNGQTPIRVWDEAGRGSGVEIESSLNLIQHLMPCGDGIVVSAAGPTFGLLDSKGAPAWMLEGVQVDMRSKLREHFMLSADARQVRFGLKSGSGEPVLFDLDGQQLSDLNDSSRPIEGLTAATTEGIPVTDWEDGEPKIAGRGLGLEQYELARSLAIAPDKQRFVLGADFHLRAFDQKGESQWDVPAPGAVWGVNIPREGKVVVAAYNDGTFRWHRLEDGRELLALFVDAKDRRWVLWTPKGYYTASPGGEELIGWHVNRGWNEAADFFPAARFRNQFYRPDIVQLVLTTLDEEMAITRANLLVNKKREDEDIRKRQPPVIRILSPANHSAVPDGELTIGYRLRSPSELPVTRVFAKVDGRPAAGAEIAGPLVIKSGEQLTGEITIKELPKRDLTISLIAETEQNASVPDSISLVWLGGDAAVIIKPRLYALIVGVGAYTGTDLRLKTPPNDADDLDAQLRSQDSVAFEGVETRVLKDSEATQQNIKAGLSWLRENVDQYDIAIVYFSGHGVSVPGSTAYLLPIDYNGEVEVTGLDKSAMLNILRRIRGTVVVFIDACFAADGIKVTNVPGGRRLDGVGWVSEFADPQNGIVAFASSDGKQRSYGGARNGHFTKALIEAMQFFNQRTEVKRLLPQDINAYLQLRVPALSDKKQIPMMLASPQARPIPLAVRN
jgi:WD40 repeat protein